MENLGNKTDDLLWILVMATYRTMSFAKMHLCRNSLIDLVTFITSMKRQL